MKCINLFGVLRSMCRMSYSKSGESTFYMPSIFQMEEYCFKDDYMKCPYYGNKHTVVAEPFR